MTLSSILKLSVKVSWDGSATFTGAYDDVSTYVRQLSCTRGRSKATDAFGAGTGQFTVGNQDGRFSPFNITSPISGQVLPARPVVVTCSYNGVTYPVFKGTCSPENLTTKLDSAPSVTFSMVDAFEKFRLKLTNTPLAKNQRTDQLITNVLNDIGWPLADRVLDVGQRTPTLFTNHNRLAINALQLIAQEEATGYVFIDGAGRVVFQNAFNRAQQPVYAVLNETFNDFSLQLRQEDMVDRVRVTYPRLSIDSVLSNVYTLSPAFKPLPPGLTTFDLDFTALGADTTITPVANTDYLGNSAGDGTGTNQTAQISVVSWVQTSSGGGTITFNNANQATIYLSLSIRGYAARAGTEVNAIAVNVAAPIVTGQQLNHDFLFMDNKPTAQAFVDWQSTVRASVRARPNLVLLPSSDALMDMVLGLQLGNRVTITDNAAPWLSGVSGDFHVEQMGLEFLAAQGTVKAYLSLLDRDLVFGSMFRVTSDVDTIARGLGGVSTGSIIVSDIDAAARGLGYIDKPLNRIGV